MADYTGHDGKSSEKAFKTIMEAVTPAASGDTIWVHPGTYNSGTGTCVSSWGWSRVGWNNKKLFLRSTDGAEKTIFEGHKNFDIENGGSAEGNGVGALRCFSVYNNTADTYGSVLQGFTFKGGATVIEKDTSLGHQDQAKMGGGTYVGGQDTPISSTASTPNVPRAMARRPITAPVSVAASPATPAIPVIALSAPAAAEPRGSASMPASSTTTTTGR